MKDALEVAGKLGIGGGIGFLLGWLIVSWVAPTTPGGMGLLILLPVVFCATVAGKEDRGASAHRNPAC
jgi:hypothetical protein